MNCNLDFDVTRILQNQRLSFDIKNKVQLRLFEVDKFINTYKLSSYLAGLTPLHEIEKKFPKKATLHDKEYTAASLKTTLENLASIKDRDKIEAKVKGKILDLLDRFDPEKGIFTFHDRKSNNSEGCIHVQADSNEYMPKVWINSLCLFALVKWQLYSKVSDKKLTFAIKKGIEWLNDNKEVFGWFECRKASTSTIIKMFETTLTLQALLRASQLKYELKEIDVDNYARLILKLQKESENGSWPSEVIIKRTNEQSQPEIIDRQYGWAVGATSYAIHFLDEHLTDNKDNILSEQVKESLKNGYKWLLNQQKDGYWKKNDKESVDYTTNALQALIKCGKHFSDDNALDESIRMGLAWLGDNFCIEANNDIIYAWPRDEDINDACERNTAFAITTLLKAGIPNDSFTIRKAMLWLLDEKPNSDDFAEVYIYCALLEYLKSLSPNYQIYFPFNQSK